MSTRVKKRTSKLLSLALAFALVLAGTGTFAGLSGILAPAMKARAEGTELNHAVTKGTVYWIGDNSYTASSATTIADSGDVMFIATASPWTKYTFYELSEAFNSGSSAFPSAAQDLKKAGLLNALSMSTWQYNTTSGTVSKQGYFGVPSKENMQNAVVASFHSSGWTSTKAGSDTAYYVSYQLPNSSLETDSVDTKRQALVAFRLNLSAEGVYVYKVGSTNYITHAIPVDEEHFPDENFRNWILSQGYGSDGVLTEKEIAGATKIYVPSENIADLTGIEYFTALTELCCDYNPLTSLDVSHNTALTTLKCSSTSLTSLDVSNNTALTGLYCSESSLTSLDLSHNTALKTLHCPDSQFTSLDLSHNTALTSLDCYNNPLTALKVKIGSSGSLATISNGGFGTIGVNDCSFTNKRISLGDPTADGYTFTGWTITGDATQAEGTYGTDFTIGSGGATITAVWAIPVPVDEEHFPDENFRNWILSQSYGSDGALTPSEIAGVTEINVCNQEIADLTGIEYFTALTELNCATNSLTSLDVSHNTALIDLQCSNNQLAELDVSNNTELKYLTCITNVLTSLDVSHNTALIQFQCAFNQLAELDVSNNTELSFLSCYGNPFATLKVKFGSSGSLATISNGGFGTIAAVNYDSSENKGIRLEDPTADGCTFTGWEITGDVTKEEGTTANIKYTDFTFGTGNATITATWTQNFTVTYADGQGNTLQSTTVTEGSATPAYSGTPTREGYTFTGWTPEVADTVTADVTYTATWKQLFTVKYVNGLGTTLLEETVAEGSATPTYTGALTREGYTFAGWSPEVASTVTADVTYTATWEQNATPMHTVTIKSQFLDTDSHLLEETQRTVDYEEGETVTIEAPTVDGYFIVGQTSVTLTVDDDSTVVFVYQQNPATDPTDPTDPEEKPYSVTVALPFKMRWQGISGENITKTLGNVKIEYTSKQYGRFAGVALLVVDTSRLPDGKQIKVSIPNRNTTINVGGVDLTASVVSFEDAILDNSGSCQLRIDLVTDRSDLLYDDFFGKPISGSINLSVEELT